MKMTIYGGQRYPMTAQILTLDQMTMYAHMMALKAEKEKLDVKLVNNFPALSSIHSPVFVGSFTWYCQQEKWKALLQKAAISTSEGWASPAELARNYITVKYTKRRRVTTDQYHEVMRPRSQPLLAIPGTYGDCVYLDLKSAYWSILKIIGWDVDYFPGRWLSVKSNVSDFPFSDNKLSRNSLVSVGVLSKTNFWTGEKLISLTKSNGLVNMVLWSAVQDILNGIAWDMARAGALYINTDGYIFRMGNSHLAYEIAEAWGLPLDEKYSGVADVIAAGTYSIGTKPNRRVQMMKPIPCNSIRPVETEWLRQRVKRFSEVRQRNKVDVPIPVGVSL